MQSEKFLFPAYEIGENIIEKAAPLIASLGHRVLVIGGENALHAAGKKLEAALHAANPEMVEIQKYGGECTFANIKRLTAIGIERQADFVIGVGGGKALDTAKACAAQLGVSIITIPTIASTCAAITKLSVVYTEENIFETCIFHDKPPAYALIDLSILASAPSAYLRAGIGDAMAKHIECTFASRSCILSHNCNMAVTLSQAIYSQLLIYAVGALEAVRAGAASEALRQVVLANIVTTGFVSLLIEERFNGAIAHALFYGLTKLKDFEKNCLHGDAVGYGILVQLQFEGNEARMKQLRKLFRRLGIPVTLQEMGYPLKEDAIAMVAQNAVQALYRDRAVPCLVEPEAIKASILSLEALA